MAHRKMPSRESRGHWFLCKNQSGFKEVKLTHDHLFYLSQIVIESLNGGAYVIASFLDIEKAFDKVIFRLVYLAR